MRFFKGVGFVVGIATLLFSATISIGQEPVKDFGLRLIDNSEKGLRLELRIVESYSWGMSAVSKRRRFYGLKKYLPRQT